MFVGLEQCRSKSTVWLGLLLVGSLVLSGCSGFTVFNRGDSNKKVIVGERVAILNLEEDLEVDPRIASQPVRLPLQEANADWPQPGGNATHSMGHLSLDGELRTVWKKSVGAGSSRGARLTASPIVADGKLYVLDAAVRISAVDAKTGKKIWKKDLTPKGEPSAAGAGGGITINLGQLYVATGFGELYALKPDTGEEIWKTALGVPIHNAPVAEAGRVFVATIDNQLHAISGFDGQSLWSHQSISEGAGIFSDTNPAVVEDVVIAPFTSGELIALRVENGLSSWSEVLVRSGRPSTLSDLKAIAARPVADGGQVIAVGHSGRMVAVDIRTGERIWSRNIASVQTPWVAGGYIYNVTIDGQVICLMRRDGRLRWIRELNTEKQKKSKKAIQWVGPVLAGNQLVLFSSKGKMVVLSPYTGEILQTNDIGAGIYTSPVVADDTLYVVNDKAKVIALRGKRKLTAADVISESEVLEDGEQPAEKKEEKKSWFRRIF